MAGAALEARIVDGGIEALKRRRDGSVEPVCARQRRCVQGLESTPRAAAYAGSGQESAKSFGRDPRSGRRNSTVLGLFS